MSQLARSVFTSDTLADLILLSEESLNADALIKELRGLNSAHAIALSEDIASVLIAHIRPVLMNHLMVLEEDREAIRREGVNVEAELEDNDSERTRIIARLRAISSPTPA